MLELLPSAPVLHIGIFRERTTLQPVEYYSKLPANKAFDVSYILDPVVATGGSVIAAVDMFKEMGARKIVIVCICISEPGLRALHEKHPEVQVFTAAVDTELNLHGEVIPGFGDTGNRLFNSLV